MKYWRASILFIGCFFSTLFGMDGRESRLGVQLPLSGHRRVASAGGEHRKPKNGADILNIPGLAKDLTSSGGYTFEDERPASRSRRNARVFVPEIEVHAAQSPFEQRQGYFDSDTSSTSADLQIETMSEDEMSDGSTLSSSVNSADPSDPFVASSPPSHPAPSKLAPKKAGGISLFKLCKWGLGAFIVYKAVDALFGKDDNDPQDDDSQ